MLRYGRVEGSEGGRGGEARGERKKLGAVVITNYGGRHIVICQRNNAFVDECTVHIY